MNLLALAIDIAVPPLSLLLALRRVSLAATALAVVFGISPVPLIMSLGNTMLFAGAGILAWWTYGRDLLKANAPVSIVGYAAGSCLSTINLFRAGRLRNGSEATAATLKGLVLIR